MYDRAPAPGRKGEAAASSTGSSADEATADEARSRLHRQGIVPIEPDERIGPLLDVDEVVIAVRRSAWLERRQRARDDAAGLSGDLYVTTRRLLHLGRTSVVYRLDEIREAEVSVSTLLLLVGDNSGLTIGVGDPRLLRVEIAAARAAARIHDRDERIASSTPAGDDAQAFSR